MKSFECSICGECCKHMEDALKNLPEAAYLIGIENAKFPFTHKNGICEKLSIDNRCTVYDKRPFICNAEKMATLIAEKSNLNKESIYMQFKENCKQLQHKSKSKNE